jgi:MEDS: MEthanogen/methylotroph, DcmR Sensory domain
MDAHGTSAQVAPNARGENRHICAFFNGIEEHYRVLRPFIKEGFDRGDRAFHLIDPERREDHLKRLADAGIKVEEEMESGHLEVQPWQNGPLQGERFDQDTWIEGFEDILRSGRTAGYARTRYLAQMEWALVDMPGLEELIEFETRVNYIVPKYEDPVICSYDLSKFSASTVIYALRTHPVVIIGDLLQENPFYVDPDQLLLELRQQQSQVGAGTAQ